MAIFVKLKQFLRLIGFLEFNIRCSQILGTSLRIITLSVLLCGFSATLAYPILEEGASLQEQIQSIAAALAYLYSTGILLIFECQKQQFHNIIENIEKKIKEREREFNHTVYKKSNSDFETLTIRMIIFINVFLVLLLMLPTTIISYYNYYMNNMGEASFIAAVPIK